MRILVVKTSSLGDLFHALPAVHALRTGLDATIDWVVNEAYAPLVACFDDVSRVIPFPRHALLRQGATFLRELRRNSYDMVVDLQGLLKSALTATLARSPRRIGPSFPREGAHCFYHETAGTPDRRRHAVEENLDIARHLGLPPSPPAFPLHLPAMDPGAPRPRIAVLPASRWPTKNWPTAHFATALDAIRARCEASFFLLGAAAEVDTCARLEALTHVHVNNLCGKTGLVEMAALLQAMDLVIANDSGPVHIAAALGVPTITVYGPTDPARTRPYGPAHTVLTHEVPCRPCFARRCAIRSHACMREVTPARMADAVADTLAHRPPPTA